MDWPNNVTVLGKEGIEIKEYPDLNTHVYGFSWDRGEIQEDILKDFGGLDEDRVNILVIHGDLLNKESKYLPLDKSILVHLGFDYIALGHIHKPIIISDKMAYCGSPEPLDFGETGEHGIIFGTISDGATSIDFIPFSKRIFIERPIEIDETMGYFDIINKIQECDNKESKGKNLYRIILKGILNSGIEVNVSDMERSLQDDFYYIEIVDETIIDYDLDELARDNRDNIVGYFIEEMKKKDLDDRINRQALYIGLEALLKGKVEL